MLKNIYLFLIASFVGFFLFVSGFLLLHIAQNTYPYIPPTQFSLSKAPIDSLVGNLATLSGEVLWESRTASTPSAIFKAHPVQQGELLATKDNGTFTLNFPNVVVATASAKTTVNIIQTLPANIVLQQQNGTVSYQILSSRVPVSVRGLDLLINLNESTTKINVDTKKSEVDITVLSGTITLAYTDTNDNSVVKNFSKGQEILFDNNTKTLEIL